MSSVQTSNFLQSNQFILVIPSFEVTRFLATSFQLPGVNLPSAIADSSFSRMKFAGDKAEFPPLEFNFIVDEQLKNYYEIYNWLMAISYAKNFEAFKKYPNKTSFQQLGEQDIKVVVLNSKNNAIATFTFYNAIPISLSGIPMASTVDDVDYIKSTVIFDYDYFDLDLETLV